MAHGVKLECCSGYGCLRDLLTAVPSPYLSLWLRSPTYPNGARCRTRDISGRSLEARCGRRSHGNCYLEAYLLYYLALYPTRYHAWARTCPLSLGAFTAACKALELLLISKLVPNPAITTDLGHILVEALERTFSCLGSYRAPEIALGRERGIYHGFCSYALHPPWRAMRSLSLPTGSGTGEFGAGSSGSPARI